MTTDQATAILRGTKIEATRRANVMEQKLGKRTYISFAWRAIAEETKRALDWMDASQQGQTATLPMPSLQQTLNNIREMALTIDSVPTAQQVLKMVGHIGHSFETGSCAGIESYGQLYSWERDDELAAVMEG